MRYVLLSLFALGCIDTREPPARLPQATISYGPRMILVDETRAGTPNSAACTRLTNVSTSTFAEGVEAVDGKAIVFRPGDPSTTDRMVPHNCFIEVTQRDLRVDRVEVTNELYQLCIDSGACQKPDPSKAGKGPLCNDEDEFDVCPLVEVTQSQASNFCNWVGRRLPSGLEHIAIRQQNISDKSDPVVVAGAIYPTGGAAPNSCDQAVLAANSCLKPRPVDIAGDTVTGAAPMDTVNGIDPEGGGGNVPIYDLMGNVSEWTGDLHPVSRGPKGDDLPWFCVAALTEMEFSAANPPVCPATAKCVYGSYIPYDGATYGVYPVCITSDNGAFSGTRGSLFGGSYRDETTTRDVLGTFGRRVEAQPEDLPDTQRAREFGIRCVGQRDSAQMDGTPPAFDDLMEVLSL